MLASLPEIREFAHSKAARGIGRDALDVLFTEARTANGFLPEQVAADILERVAAKMAHYNAALQTGYFILAARALGLDAGPMGGFDKAKVDAEFFPDGSLKSDLLINLGYGDDAKLHPRNPRLALDEIARFV